MSWQLSSGDPIPRPFRRAARVGPCAALLLCGCAALGHAPPLHEVETGLPGGMTEERAAFGFVEERRHPDGALESAVRPFVVERREPGRPFLRSWLPPFGSQTASDIRARTRVWPLFSADSIGTPAERESAASDDDTFILPFVGWGGEPGQDDWWMAFPLYGQLRQKLFTDEIEFAAFPLWARTRTGGWTSTHVLFPLIAWGDGDGRSHRRFLPFWSQTDGPNVSRRTAAWPFVHWGTETRGDRTFDGWFVFPFVGHRASRDGSFSEWTALFPFFEWSDDARTGDSHRAVLWPFHKTTRRPAEGMSSTWWWPFWGEHRSEDETSQFFAWPFGWESERRVGARVARHTMIVPFWMERDAGPAGEPPDRSELRAWPLFSFERTPSGVETLRVPELIPFFGWRSGETAWADLVALFRWRADDEGRAAWDGPLGGIVRWRRAADGSSRLTLLWWIDVPTGAAR